MTTLFSESSSVDIITKQVAGEVFVSATCMKRFCNRFRKAQNKIFQFPHQLLATICTLFHSIFIHWLIYPPNTEGMD